MLSKRKRGEDSIREWRSLSSLLFTEENVLCIHDFNHFVVFSHSIFRMGQSSSHFESVGVVYLIWFDLIDVAINLFGSQSLSPRTNYPENLFWFEMNSTYLRQKSKFIVARFEFVVMIFPLAKPIPLLCHKIEQVF